jgi:hypothetical protein
MIQERLNRFSPECFDFVIEGTSHHVKTVGKHIEPFGNGEVFAKNYKSSNLTCSPQNIFDAFIKLHFEEQSLESYKLLPADTLYQSTTHGYRNKSLINDLLFKINTLFPHDNFILIYIADTLSLTYMEEAENTTENIIKKLTERVEMLEHENRKLIDIIVFPKKIAGLEDEEQELRSIISVEEDTSTEELNKCYEKLTYFLREQKRRENMLKELLREQLMKEMTPSAPEPSQY